MPLESFAFLLRQSLCANRFDTAVQKLKMNAIINTQQLDTTVDCYTAGQNIIFFFNYKRSRILFEHVVFVCTLSLIVSCIRLYCTQ